MSLVDRFATTPIGEAEQQACSCDLTVYAMLRLSSHWSRNLPNTRNEQAQTGLERFCSASPLGSKRYQRMGKGGRPRKYDPIADDISFAIDEMENVEVKKLINQSQIDVLDGEARTPLIYSAFSNNVEILEWLIDNDANINHQDRGGWCALHAAAQEGHLQIVELLLNRGANPNLIDSYGNGPLWTATMNAKGDETIPNLLIDAGSDANHKNNAGRSPTDIKNTMCYSR